MTIRTRYQGPTDWKGSRITATTKGRRLSVPWRYELSTGENHQRAARLLAERIGAPAPVFSQELQDRRGYEWTQPTSTQEGA